MGDVSDTLFWIEAGLAGFFILIGIVCVVIMISEFILDRIAWLFERIWHMGVITEVVYNETEQNRRVKQELEGLSDEELIDLIREWHEFTPALIHIRNLPTHKV